MTQEVTTPEGTPPGSGGEGQPQIPQRPENVPEKFWNAEKGELNTDALLSSYTELEKKHAKPASEGGTEGGEGGEGAGDPPNPGTGTLEEYNAAVEKATAELASETGTISDETYAAFEKQGITRQQIDTYVEGQHAIFELRKRDAEDAVGGRDAYKAMLDWAGANYNEADANAYNDAVFGADKKAALAAVEGLKAKYEEAMGTEGRIVTDGTNTASGDGYKNKSEWLADIRKPEYKKDAGFRENVRKKLEAALKAGVDMGVAVSAG